MVHRKLAADNIFTGYEMLGPDTVLIVSKEGDVIDLIQEDKAGGNIERFSGILTPGFINCHCHLELSHMKGLIRKHCGMVPFLLSVMSSRNKDEKKILEAISAAEAEMKNNGIVAVGDICNTGHTLAQKKGAALYYHNFIETSGFIDEFAQLRFDSAVQLYNEFNKLGPSSIVPHAPYSVSDKLFSLINYFKPGSLLTMHNQESMAENEFIENAAGDLQKLFAAINVDVKGFKGTGESAIVTALSRISNDHKIILVHNVTTSRRDLGWAAQRIDNLYWCLCPHANKYINNVLPDVKLLQENNCKIVLGTDSLASNDELNILSELKLLKENFPSIPLAELLKWATINGADALGIGNKYGSFEIGKRPGVNLLGRPSPGIGNKMPFRITPLLVPATS